MLGKTAIFALVVACSFATAAAALASETKPHVDTSGVNAQPPYPATALADRESGAVVLAVAVDANGAVEKVSPVKTSGFDDLDEAAITGVLKWKFVPATRNGEPVDGTAIIQIVFQPPDSAAGQPEKAGVQEDYLSRDFTMNASVGKSVDTIRPLPCANGSLSVSMRFVDINREPHSVDVISFLEVGIGSGAQSVVIQTYPAYYPPKWQMVVLALLGADASKFATRKFQFYPNFRDPVPLNLSWKEDGQILATVNGQGLPMRLPAKPTDFIFHVTESTGRFTDARLLCTPN